VSRAGGSTVMKDDSQVCHRLSAGRRRSSLTLSVTGVVY
jgi:hypothetical protein